MHPVICADNRMLSVFVGSRRMWVKHVCVCLCVCVCIWDAGLCLRCSSGVCWCLLNDLAAGNRLSGWDGGYHVNYFTHTLPAKRATQVLSSHTHGHVHANALAHAPEYNTHKIIRLFLSFCRFSVFLPFAVWRPWTSIPFCFQERLFYILINSTLSCEINWHSFNDLKFLRGCSFVSACQWAASEIGLNVLSSHTPG